MNKYYFILFLLGLLLLPAFAQSPSGTFVGRVLDASSAAIPGVAVTAHRRLWIRTQQSL